MKDKNHYLTELENFWYDCQYQDEKSKDLEIIRTELNNCVFALNDMKYKNYNTSSMLCKIEDLKSRIKIEEDYLLHLKTKRTFIESKIDSMTQPYKNILFLKYMKNYSFDQIASKMNYSSKRIYQLHKEALTNYVCLCEQSMIANN